MTDFHPESWNPAWSVETILVGLVSFFVSDAETGYGTVQESAARRQALAAASQATNEGNPEFVALFPEFLNVAGTASHSSGGTARACHTMEVQAGGGQPHESRRAGFEVERSLEGGTASTALAECWICREATEEVLVHPCACRGSMTGVHASCVERWVQHHRRTGGASERPRCSVCRAPYAGHEVRPGLAGFARNQLQDLVGQLGRSVALVFLLMGFQDASQGTKSSMPFVVRTAFAALFWVICSVKFAVLVLSLPLHRAPPRNPRLRRLHVSDPQKLAKHVAESLAVVSVLGLWCVTGELPIAIFLPFGIAALGLTLRLCARDLSLACLSQAVLAGLRLTLKPVAQACRAMRLLRRHPRCLVRWAHPLEAGPHILVAGLAVLLCLRCTSNVPLLLLWALHSSVLVAGVVERLAWQRLQWRRGWAWWYAVQLAALGAYVANAFCDFPRGVGEPDRTWMAVLVASAVWLAAVCAAAVAANWSLCVRQYRHWQRQHSVFTLTAPAARVVPVVPMVPDV
eukprot:CAMPEP_0179127260 /NCGR_PEP_ID=MMETSP0796-20121207/60279_1 /TAXON_ID=73915 /ORGANISM="Pyrodinium bahamense, Strain pbaha01" /LENGTH=515 /DNA_ID=CAMNT_0020826047 /DNA_START=370 /DNA_END=1917 /DNA_ORIENTATION=-